MSTVASTAARRSGRLRDLLPSLTSTSSASPRSPLNNPNFVLSPPTLRANASLSRSFWTSSLSSTLTPEQSEFRSLASDFARERLAPHSAEWDETHHFPIDVLRDAASLGFGGLYVKDEELGGAGLGRADAAIIFEALAHGDVPIAAYLSIHNMVCAAIDTHGSDEQKKEFLPRLTSMESLASYCLTEPGAGSDAARLTTSACFDRDAYVINGSKAFISGAGASDVYLVMARTGNEEEGGDASKSDSSSLARGISAFLVKKDDVGVSFGKLERKMGWNAQPTRAVIFDDVVVPESRRLGPRGGGFSIAMAALDGGRVNIAACSLGGAAFALDVARAHVKTRRQFNTLVKDFQATQFKIADMATALHASRLMVSHAARALDAGAPDATLMAAMAKRYATDACFGVANDALQLLGGYGYLKEYPIEQVVRDLRVHSILEGTNEVMKLIINRDLDRQSPVD